MDQPCDDSKPEPCDCDPFVAYCEALSELLRRGALTAEQAQWRYKTALNVFQTARLMREGKIDAFNAHIELIDASEHGIEVPGINELDADDEDVIRQVENNPALKTALWLILKSLRFTIQLSNRFKLKPKYRAELDAFDQKFASIEDRLRGLKVNG